MQEATELLELALDYFRNNPKIPIKEASHLLDLLTDTYMEQEKFAAAVPHLRQRLTIYETAEFNGGPLHFDALLSLGTAMTKTGALGSAGAYLLQALRIQEAKENPDPQMLAGTLSNLGDVYLAQQRYAEAEAAFRRAVPISRVQGHDWLGKWMHQEVNLAWAVLYQGRSAEAEKIWLDVIETVSETDGKDAAHLILVYDPIGQLYRSQERYLAASAAYTEALRLTELNFGPDAGNIGFYNARIGEMYAGLGELEQAELALVRAEATSIRVRGASDPNTLWIKDLLDRTRNALEDLKQDQDYNPETSKH